MAPIGTYRINEKKCATCKYWAGDSMAGGMKTPGNYCSKWDLAPELR